MMIRHAFTTSSIVAFVCLSGCSKPTGETSGSTVAASSQPSAPAMTASAPASAAAPPTGNANQRVEYQCNTVIPSAFREKHGFAGWRIDQASSRGGINCHYYNEKRPAQQRGFDYKCTTTRAWTPEILKIRHDTFAGMAKDIADIPNLGRAAWSGTALGIQEIQVLDDKNCEMMLTFGMDKPPPDDFTHAEAYARETLGVLQAATNN